MSEQTPAHAETPRHRSWVKVVAAVLAVALVAGAGVVAFSLLIGEPNRTITRSRTAGGMTRDAELEDSSADEREVAAQQFASLYDGQARAQLGIYDQDDQDRGPVGPVNVLGAEIEGETDPQALVSRVRDTAEQNGFETTPVEAGDDAQGMCAAQDTGAYLCFWATTTSFGQVFTTTEDWTVQQLNALMVAVRADVETTD